MNKVEIKANKIMATKDMTSSQIKQTNSQKILKYLQENIGEISNEEISRETGINKTNIPREIKKLEGQGHNISKRYEQIGRSKFVWFLLTSSQKKQTISQNKKNKHLVEKRKKVERLEPTKKDQNKRGERLNIDFTNGMVQDLSIYNQIIPISFKQEITHWILNNLDLLYKGAYYYSKAWEGRYKKRLREEPDSPVITDFLKMQKVIDKIKELKEFKKKLEYPKKKVINNSKS